MPFQPSYFKADLFKILSNPVRIQILDTLRQGEISVNDIAQYLELESSSVSQQLAILRRYHLVKGRREGNYIFYSVNDLAIFKLLDAAKEVFNNHLVEVKSALAKIE
jgi:DNA-binding transcriptional ArsR family regulator